MGDLLKALFISICLLIAASAHSAYKVGDFAVYDFKKNGHALELKNEIVAVKRETVTIEETISEKGNMIARSKVLKKITDLQLDEWMHETCLRLPDSYETITVPSGTFTTCHIIRMGRNNNAREYIHFGKVPFGIVKFRRKGSNNGSDMEMELRDFRNWASQ